MSGDEPNVVFVFNMKLSKDVLKKYQERHLADNVFDASETMVAVDGEVAAPSMGDEKRVDGVDRDDILLDVIVW